MKVSFTTALCVAAIVFSVEGCTKDDDILIDIIFVVDGSGSIGTLNFDLVKSWLINATTAMFEKFGQRAQFAVFEYSNKDPAYKRIPIDKSTKFEIAFRLGNCDTVSCMTSRIRNMEYLHSQTYTYYALRRAIEVEFPYSRNWPVAKKAIILLTDGAANDGANLPLAYDACVQQDITGFAIGVGNYKLDQLRVFANGGVSDDRVFTRTDFGSLTSVVTSLDYELQKSGFFCDECAARTDDCSRYADCIDHADGYDCVCIEGYYGDGKECKPVDYCNPDPCKTIENTECIVESQIPRCVCLEGYKKIGESCVEIDECANNPCQGEHSECVDLVGSYTCQCESGYLWDGLACIPPQDDPSQFITILTFVIAIVILFIVIVVAIYMIRRQHTYTIGGGRADEEARDEFMMEEQKRSEYPDA